MRLNKFYCRNEIQSAFTNASAGVVELFINVTEQDCPGCSNVPVECDAVAFTSGLVPVAKPQLARKVPFGQVTLPVPPPETVSVKQTTFE